jgi:transposase
MPGPYSDDLRAKVMAALQRGEKKSHVSAMFHISRDTLDRWLKRQAATGSAKAAQGYQRGHSHRIKDWQRFVLLPCNTGTKLRQRWHSIGLVP